MWHALEKIEMHAEFWCGNPEGIRRLAKLWVEESVTLSLLGEKARSGLN